MAQVDASRFLANLHTLFAPNIADGQVFTAYIDGDENSLVIQGENILYPSSGNSHFGILAAQLSNTSKLIQALQNKADSVEDLCRDIPFFVSNIENISGQFEGNTDFEYDILHSDLVNVNENLAAIEEKNSSLEALFLSENNNGADAAILSNLDERVSIMEYILETLQQKLDDLASAFHSRVISENEISVSN